MGCLGHAPQHILYISRLPITRPHKAAGLATRITLSCHVAVAPIVIHRVENHRVALRNRDTDLLKQKLTLTECVPLLACLSLLLCTEFVKVRLNKITQSLVPSVPTLHDNT